MFEVITEYNKDIFCKCYKVHHKIHSKYNAKRNIFLMIMCFIMATIALLLGIAKPETFHTIYAAVFFYISSSIFFLSLITMSDKGIKRRVDKIFSKNPNMDLVAKYVFNEENFIAIKGQNDPTYYDYSYIIYMEIVDEHIILLLKNKKFIALKNSDELIMFLKTKSN